MAAPRKAFRIEDIIAARPDAAAEAAEAAWRHAELMQELRALRAAMAAAALTARQTTERSQASGLDAAEVEQLRLRHELHLVHHAIGETRQELAGLHGAGLRDQQITRAADELDAVVGGTEQATQRILAAAEDIDRAANTLAATSGTELNENAIAQTTAQEIRHRVIDIFEACNFQDLTGQRIARVMATLKSVEERVLRIITIWGGPEAIAGTTTAGSANANAGTCPTHGPRLEGDRGHASQEEIDEIFSWTL